MAGNTFSVAIEADISGVKKQLKDLSRAGDAETKKLVKDMSRNLKKAEKAANKLRKSLDGAVSKKAKASFMSLKEASEGSGGALGGSVGMIEKFGKAAGEMSTVMGPLGAVLVGGTLAVAGLGFAAVKAAGGVISFVRAAEQWADELDAVGLSAATGAVEEFNATLDTTTLALKRVGVGLADDMAGELQGAAESTLAAVLAIEALIDRMGGLGRVAQWAGTIFENSITQNFGPGALVVWEAFGAAVGQVTGAFEGEAESMLDSVAAGKKAAAQKEKQRKLWAAVADAQKSLSQDTEKAARAAQRASSEAEKAATDSAKAQADEAKAALDAARAKQDAQQALSDILKRSASDQLSAEDKILEAHVARLAAIENVMIVANDAALAQAAADASEQRMIRETWALRISETEKAADAATAAIQGHLDQIERAQAEALANMVQGLGMLSEGFGTAGDAIDLMAQAQAREAEAAQLGIDAINERTAGEKDLIRAKIESGALTEKEGQLAIEAIKAAAKEDRKAEKRKLKEAKKNAKKLFKLSKAASLADVVFGTAAAVLQAYAMYGPPPSPLGVAGAAAAAAAGLVQAAAIAAEQPPSFAAGGLVSSRASGDHVPILASRNEGIVSPRGMAAIGADGLNALNAGGGGMAATTNVYVGGKLIEAMTVDALSSPAAAAALDVRSGLPTGQVLVYGRG